LNKTPAFFLEKYWGHESFKGSQETIIESVLQGSDVVALLPTGGGKSVCFQIPALMRNGICIVVSPLIALIKDQVGQLRKKGIKAVALTGGIPFGEVSDLLDNCLYGDYQFLYLSPERLQQELVQDRISQMNVSLIAIDEAHCISQWGIDFRPAYLQCAILRELHPEVPVIALTATATERVARDIVESLMLKDPRIFKDSFSRKNLIYSVLVEEDKPYRLLQLCKDGHHSRIVYVRSRRMTEELTAKLNRQGISADYFHGGISFKEKEKKLQAWLDNKKQVMVATNAFGMGIDKADVRTVIHYQLPDSIENYFQEAGRAGRDGKEATALLLTNESDKIRLKNQFVKVLPDVPFVKTLYNKLNNYFQIPYGVLDEGSFPFNFNQFCEQYQLNSILTFNGLRLLDQNSVIALSENFSRRTTVKFLASKNAIFSYLEAHPIQAPIIQVLLRTYGGVFEYDTKINTLLISRKAQVDEEAVYATLSMAHMDGIIAYTAEHQDMELTFLVPREDDRTINVFSGKIRHLNEVKLANVQAMLQYVENDRQCRSQQLLAYFGERSSAPCGKCDVCLKRNSENNNDLSLIEQKILTLLKEKDLTSRRLAEQLEANRESILEALQFLLEEGRISINNKNEYSIR
jgi:ATP-dependent DNA helicase RecQ